MVCQRCGSANEGGARFCGDCGAVLVASPSSPASNQAGGPAAPQYASPINRPAIAQPLPPSQPPQYAPPAQSPGAGWVGQSGPGYSPPAQSPGAGWPGQSGPGYSPSAQNAWTESPASQPSRSAPPVFAQPAAPAQPVAARKRRRRWPWILLLTVVILALVLSVSWIVLIRPAIHQQVDAQINTGLKQAISQIPSVVSLVPQGISIPTIPVTEDRINSFIAQNADRLKPVTNLHVSLKPNVITLTFQAYGFSMSVNMGLTVDSNGNPVAQNVGDSGLLSWVESPEELTQTLNNNFKSVPGQIGRSFQSIAIQDGVIQFTFASTGSPGGGGLPPIP